MTGFRIDEKDHNREEEGFEAKPIVVVLSEKGADGEDRNGSGQTGRGHVSTRRGLDPLPKKIMLA